MYLKWERLGGTEPSVCESDAGPRCSVSGQVGWQVSSWCPERQEMGCRCGEPHPVLSAPLWVNTAPRGHPPFQCNCDLAMSSVAGDEMAVVKSGWMLRQSEYRLPGDRGPC